MPNKNYREQFITWVKRSSWHPCGLEYIIEQGVTGEFINDAVEQMYMAYCAGIRKGVKIQKEKNCKK